MFPTNLITCSSCQKEKDPSEFHRRGNKLQSICKECRNTAARADYAERGKARKTQPPTPVQINPNMVQRIESLQTKLCAKAGSFSHDALDADDIYSAMIDAILTKCKPEDTDAYIMQCANWTAQAYISRTLAYSQYVEELPVDEDELEAAGFKVVGSRTVEDALVQREVLAQFEAVIKSLPEENRKVIGFLAIGMSQRDIAGELHVSEQTVSERLKKIRKQLSETFEVSELALVQY